MAFASYMEHSLPNIDPAGSDTDETGERREAPTPSMGAGPSR
jgi:hypothetical protein